MIFGRKKSKPAKTPEAPTKPAPATWHGRLEKQEMVGVVWVLHAEDGQQYELRGVEPDLILNGNRVAVTGQLAEAGFGMQMVGTPIDVRSLEAAPLK